MLLSVHMWHTCALNYDFIHCIIIFSTYLRLLWCFGSVSGVEKVPHAKQMDSVTCGVFCLKVRMIIKWDVYYPSHKNWWILGVTLQNILKNFFSRVNCVLIFSHEFYLELISPRYEEALFWMLIFLDKI